MTIEALLVLLVIGLVAGVLASAVVGGGYGIAGDIAIGVAGAFLGGMLFRAFGVASGGGIGWSILVAFVGSCVLLALIRVVRRSTAAGHT